MPERLASLLALLFLLLPASPSLAISDEGEVDKCLICHGYPGMGRYEEDGRRLVLYVNDELYGRSVHGRRPCQSCHDEGLDVIPHKDPRKVNCGTECHLTEPSTERRFSHASMADELDQSVHRRLDDQGEASDHSEDLPTCKYCHDNRILDPVSEHWTPDDPIAFETMARCKGCHKEPGWAEHAYAHFRHRTRPSRQQMEIVALCTSCHEDEVKMDRHGLENITTFKDTFHWTQVRYGVADAPDCVSCHASTGQSPHEILPRDDPMSSINDDNRVRTCANIDGVQSCHPDASERFARGRVHAYGTKAELAAGRGVGAKAAAGSLSADELRNYKLLKLLEALYKILIAVVVGGMLIHQALDAYRLLVLRKARR